MSESSFYICEGCGGKIERIISGGTGLIFKVSGFYLTDYKDKKKKIYLLHLKDIYSDHGIIGVIIIEFLNDNNVFLDTFLMSCRVLGRDVEKWFIGEIINLCKKKKINNFYIELLISDKNQVAQEFLKDSFFSKIKTFFEIIRGCTTFFC